MINKPNQKGAAIIVALFVVALIAAMAVMMLDRLQIDIRRTELIQNANNATLYAEGSIAWAKDLLIHNLAQQQPNKITDNTPIKSPIDQEDGASIDALILDAQGFFNINNLVELEYQRAFVRLIQIVSPDIEPQIAEAIAQCVIDWISPTMNNMACEEYYLKKNPSYRAPHHAMTSISELRLVKGMTPALFTKLLPYVIALPKPTLININNATAPVLMSLSQTLTKSAALAIIAFRQQTPFVTNQAFLNFDIVKNNPLQIKKFTVTSNYFLVETNVTLGKQHVIVYTLLQRSEKGSQSKIGVLWQSKGTL